MATAEYVRALGDRARKRHYHATRGRKVIAFMVQLEVEFRGTWVPVVRDDMAHGKPHVDVYETPRQKSKQFLDMDPGEVMTLADEDIKENWEWYRDEFLRRNER